MVRTTKAVSKLTVLPPLNLPSLRREHEIFDPSGRNGGLGGGGVGGLGSGSRPTSTRVGWTKLVPDNSATGAGNNSGGVDPTDVVSRGSVNYGSRTSSSGVGDVSNSHSKNAFPPLDKSIVLRGEEFPSLQAATSTLPATSRKEKYVSNEKQKQVKNDELSTKKNGDSTLEPLGISSRYGGRNGSVDDGSGAHRVVGGRIVSHGQKKQEYFPDPLPLVRMNPRSDWADDERDTSYRFVERERDVGYLKSEGYWDRDFDFPRTSFSPQKPVQYQHETEKSSSNEILGADGSQKTLRMPSHGGPEGGRWRTSAHLKDGAISQVGNDGRSRAIGPIINAITYNKYTGSGSGVSGLDGSSVFKQDPKGDRGDWGLGGRKEYWNSSAESYNNRGVDFHNNKQFKSSSVSSRNMPPTIESVAAVRDKQFSSGSLSADPFMTDFDAVGFEERDFFSGSPFGVLKRKKDPAKQTEFHDPVRESFEAELERVQKMQELERKRLIEEQERAAEKARRDSEERQRMIRDEEERQHMLEEQAREAAWRAEKEKQEAAQRSEEQKMAWEEEKRRIVMEEERREQAAKQKLRELEDKIAKREAEAAKAGASVSSTAVNDRLQGTFNDENFSVDRDVSTWEDEERKVGKVLMSSSSDSSVHRKTFEMKSRYSLPFEGSSKVFEAEKVGASSRLPLSNHDIPQTRPKWESFNSGRMAPQSELHGKSTYMSSRSHFKEGIQGPPQTGELGYQKNPIWNFSGNSNPYERHRERESEFNDRHGSEYDDINWDVNPLSSISSSYRGQFYPNTDVDKFESSGRSRYSMKQPRVLPPPIASAQITSFRRISEHGSSSFPDSNVHHGHATSEFSLQTTHHSADQGNPESYEIPQLQGEDTITEGANPSLITRCDSQSSLVVSSPPNSAPHLSEEDLDETGDFPTSDTVQEEKNPSRNVGSDVLDGNYGVNKAATLGSTPAIDDEDWPIENDNKLQQLVLEYDEDEGYGEEDDACNGENLNLSKKFEELDVEVKSHRVLAEGGSVLGFNKGSEMGLTRDDLVENLTNDETAFTVPESAVGIVEEIGLLQSVVHSEQGPTSDSAANSNIVNQKMEETDILERVDAPGGASLPVQQNDPFGGFGNNYSQRTTVSSVRSIVDFPVNIQFGLFTGPTLLPAPVSTIQIGSIQIPIHINPHTHPSLPSTLQFGQVSYAVPISPGISPLLSKSTSSVRPDVQHQVSVNKNAEGSVPRGTGGATVIPSVTKEKEPPRSLNKELALNESLSKGPTIFPEAKSVGGGFDRIAEHCSLELEPSVEKKVQQSSVSDRNMPARDEIRRVNEVRRVHRGMRSSFGERGFSGQRGGFNGRGRRFAYAVKGANLRSSIVPQDMQQESNMFKRKPLQATTPRDRNYRRPTFQLDHSAGANVGDGSNYMAKSQSRPKRNTASHKRVREKIDSESSTCGNVDVDSGDALAKKMAKKLPVNSEKTSQHNELGRNVSKEDIDAPLQSGVVCVFSQPGIEAPSDEDDFIEVRSRRHLNDRRKLRDQGLKPSKPVTSMQPHMQRSARKTAPVAKYPDKLHGASNSEMPRGSNLNTTASAGRTREVLKKELPAAFTSVSQITSGSSTVNPGGQSIKSESRTNVMSESRDKVVKHAQLSLTNSERSGQQVLSLTQTQLDEAMNPTRYDSNIPNIGGHDTIKSDQILPKPISAKDKSLVSCASTVNSLLAGEKIQFGAVTPQTVLPSSKSVVVASDGIGQTSVEYPESKNDRSNLIFNEDTHPIDSSSPLPDTSAAAAATISEKEMAKGELGPAIVPGTKSFDGSNLDGVNGDHQITTLSQGDDSLTVSLPADLSVETTPISMWPPLPSPQSDSTTQMLSHFPGPPHTHFPYYEMNRLLGGPIFNLEESTGTQSQPTATPASTGSGPPVNWPHHHFGMDSFYGQPIGYPSPYMGPIGVQGPPPHMALYDHFPPVGQFGPVGLSLMGPTFFPRGNQSEWKQNAAYSPMHAGDGNMYNNTSKMAPPNSMAPVHHLAPGSPLLSAASPLPVFDVAPFQPQAGLLPSDINRADRVSSPPVSSFPQPQIPVSAGSASKGSMPVDSNVTASSAELGLVDSLSPLTSVSSDQVHSVQTPLVSSSTNAASGSKSKNLSSSTRTCWIPQKNNTSAHSGYNTYPRSGGLSQRNNNSGNEWSHRRTGFHGRRQPQPSFGAPKMKQIYVAKQANTGNSAN